MDKTKIKRKKSAIILLNMLLKGYPVIKDNITYILSDDYYLCQEAIGRDGRGNERKVLLKIGLGSHSLKNFIDWANSFTIDELAINGANAVLNDLKCGK